MIYIISFQLSYSAMLPTYFIVSHCLEDRLSAPNLSSSELRREFKEDWLAATGPIRFGSNGCKIYLLEEP
jgi:hypothetical protein